jgi:hypothetical protein
MDKDEIYGQSVFFKVSELPGYSITNVSLRILFHMNCAGLTTTIVMGVLGSDY